MSDATRKLVLGPRRDDYTKQYGKFAVRVYTLTLHRIVVYEMEGYIMPEHIDAYIDDLLALAAEQKPLGMIADPRQMKVLNAEFQRAVQTRFWPGIARLGVKRNPGIVPAATVTQTSVKRLVAAVGETIELEGGEKVEIALLETLEDCVSWILAAPSA